MPQIKQYDPTIGIPSVVADPGIADAGLQGYSQGLKAEALGAASVGELGKEVGGLSKNVTAWAGDIDTHLKKVQRDSDIMTYSMKANRELSDAAFTLSSDPDWATHRQQFQSTAEQIKQQHLDQISDPLTRLGYEKSYNQYFEHYDTAVRGNARKLQVKSLHGALLERTDDRETMATQALDDSAALQQLIGVNTADWGKAVSEGVVDYDDAIKAHIKFKDTLAFSRIKNLISTNPAQARQALLAGFITEADGTQTPIKLGDPRSYQALTDAANNGIDRAINREWTGFQRNMMLDQKAVKEQQDLFSKRADSLYNQGFKDPNTWNQLNDLLEANRDNRAITPEVFRHYKDKVRGDVVEDIKANEDYLKGVFATPQVMMANPLDSAKKDRVRANVVRNFQDMVKEGYHPRDASARAEEFGKRVDVTIIPAPSGLGLEGDRKYDLTEINAAKGRLADMVTNGTIDPHGSDFKMKFQGLQDLEYANRYWAVNQQTPEQTKVERNAEMQKAEADRVRRQQEAQGVGQQNQQKKPTRGGR